MTHSVLVLNGPNLNMLGIREPEIYGTASHDDIKARCHAYGDRLGVKVEVRQSNHEGELVTWIQEARDNVDGLVVNAAAYTHTSVAILDALSTFDKPIIEVHLSNIHKREEFRHRSFVSPNAEGVICGLGVSGYEYALDYLAKKFQSKG